MKCLYMCTFSMGFGGTDNRRIVSTSNPHNELFWNPTEIQLKDAVKYKLISLELKHDQFY